MKKKKKTYPERYNIQRVPPPRRRYFTGAPPFLTRRFIDVSPTAEHKIIYVKKKTYMIYEYYWMLFIW